MKVIRGIYNYKYTQNTFLTMGTFDGVHLGHRFLIDKMIMQAKNNDATAAVLTFDAPPKAILGSKAKTPMLTPAFKKELLLAELGVDVLIEQKFTKHFSEIEYDAFIQQFILSIIKPKHIFVGHDFRFGRQRMGDVDKLRKVLRQNNIAFTVAEPFLLNNERVSSTLIRKLLLNGDVSTARKFLGRPYSIYGSVCKGSKLAAPLGYPTANINHKFEVTPSDGVYAVKVIIKKREFRGICYIGPSPTFHIKKKKIEVHIFDYSGILYGADIKVLFYNKIRNPELFDNEQELVSQIKRDIEAVHSYFE